MPARILYNEVNDFKVGIRQIGEEQNEGCDTWKIDRKQRGQRGTQTPIVEFRKPEVCGCARSSEQRMSQAAIIGESDNSSEYDNIMQYCVIYSENDCLHNRMEDCDRNAKHKSDTDIQPVNAVGSPQTDAVDEPKASNRQKEKNNKQRMEDSVSAFPRILGDLRREKDRR